MLSAAEGKGARILWRVLEQLYTAKNKAAETEVKQRRRRRCSGLCVFTEGTDWESEGISRHGSVCSISEASTSFTWNALPGAFCAN